MVIMGQDKKISLLKVCNSRIFALALAEGELGGSFFVYFQPLGHSVVLALFHLHQKG